ncbi:MAG: hypothetical protein JNM18_08245 [Planctomycetaceae bacterium]|nr:hypothetical protein [Planctomycetaceae bacterium]
MRLQQFLEHHGVANNPFAEEDAQTDPVFKDFCIGNTYHPTWDKIYGDPRDPATSIVFGEKGAGKTALRLQIVRHVQQFNAEHATQRLFVIEYDDFNPFLDRFRDKLSRFRARNNDRVLAEWRLWDHMDAILSLGVTQLVDAIVKPDKAGPVGAIEPSKLDRNQARDLLLLTALYDQSLAESFRQRWQRVRRAVRFYTWRSRWSAWLGVLLTIVTLGLIGYQQKWDALFTPWPYLIIAAAWLPWLARTARLWWRCRGIVRQLRVVLREVTPLRQLLGNFTADQLAGQPLPDKDRTDDRFELLAKFQAVLNSLGFAGVLVIVDRLDEPHLVNGSPEQMRALIWPMLDNKFLKHPGIGFKLLLPVELSQYIAREDREFYQRARLDKQNMIPSLEWTGEALYDVANARLRACAASGKTPSVRTFFDDTLSDRRLIDGFRALRVPRHLFRFLYRVFVSHANTHTDENPVWQISAGTFESQLALYQRDQDAFDRGLGAG